MSLLQNPINLQKLEAQLRRYQVNGHRESVESIR